ncbi:J domain-containing protein [Cyanobium gracile]|uniref:DnaJ-class molecular chaperone with C-terminal Zn finger domain n=1 Tax=Cyanobium gracile (strain ATCC 27147 / PCC 6307) TaxID=292564 RepID=K9PBJ9_CYAGP|nr:J domain-containing protein [Cyanobium gracile]AFY30126.1 DnaJ-class molecular chaperone with C-terminal Zn finger domain [Cyanobium gracile PCC 6307]
MSSTAKPSTPTHYQVLQLQPTATDQELRQAFRGLSKRYHPDTTALPASEAEVAFRQLRQAYAVLSDPAARRLYDAALAQPAPPAPLRPAPAPVVRPVPVRRALSGGEWFALLLLAVALVLSLVLGLGVAWARGAELMAWPSWWSELEAASVPPAPLAPAPVAPAELVPPVGEAQALPSPPTPLPQPPAA